MSIVLILASWFFTVNATENYIDCKFSTIRRRRSENTFQIQFWRVELDNDQISFNEVAYMEDTNGTQPDIEYISDLPLMDVDLSISSRINQPQGKQYVVSN